MRSPRAREFCAWVWLRNPYILYSTIPIYNYHSVSSQLIYLSRPFNAFFFFDNEVQNLWTKQCSTHRCVKVVIIPHFVFSKKLVAANGLRQKSVSITPILLKAFDYFECPYWPFIHMTTKTLKFINQNYGSSINHIKYSCREIDSHDSNVCHNYKVNRKRWMLQVLSNQVKFSYSHGCILAYEHLARGINGGFERPARLVFLSFLTFNTICSELIKWSTHYKQRVWNLLIRNEYQKIKTFSLNLV